MNESDKRDDSDESIGDLLSQSALVHRLARDLTRDVAASDDVAQDALLAAIEVPPREPGSLRAWFRTVIRRIAHRDRLANDRRARREREWSHRTRGAADPAVIAAERELLKRVVDAVYDLEEPYRQTILLRYLEELDVDAVARRMDVPRETVRTRLQRGLARIRTRLDRDHRSRSAWLLPLARLARPIVGGWLASRVAAAILVIATIGLGVRAVIDRDVAPTSASAAADPATVEAPIVEVAPPTALEREEVANASNQVSAVPDLIGRVVDSKHAPIPRARVFVLDVDLGDAAAATRAPLHSRITDENGRFTTPGSEARMLSVAIEAEGFAARALAIAGNGDTGDIELLPGFALFGVVRDLERRPIAGATIRYRTVQEAYYREVVATSDLNGRYRIEGAGDPSRYETGSQSIRSGGNSMIAVHAEHPEFAPFDLHYGPTAYGFDAEGDIPLDIWMPRGATFEGRAVDAETGAGVPGLRMVLRGAGAGNLFVNDRPLEFPFRRPEIATATTDAAGGFVLHRVPAWGVSGVGYNTASLAERVLGYLRPECAGWLPVERWFSVNAPDDGATVGVDIPVLATGKLRGQIVDAAGAPIAGASVSASLAENKALGEQRLPFHRNDGEETDADGRFELELPLTRNCDDAGELRVQRIARERQVLPLVGLRAGMDRDLGTISFTTEEIPLRVRVDVVDADERPIPRAQVELMGIEKDETNGADYIRDFTDALGHVELHVTDDRMTDAPRCRVVVEMPGYAVAYSDPLEAKALTPSTAPSLRIVMERASDGGIREKRPAPAPTTGATLLLTVTDAATGAPILRLGQITMVDDHGGERWCHAVEPGVYRFEDVPVGDWRVVAQGNGYMAHPRLSVSVVAPGVELTASLVLSRGAVLRGVVRASDGSDVGGCRFWFQPEGKGRYQTLTLDSRGRFEGSGFDAGDTFSITVVGKGQDAWFTTRPADRVTVPAGDTEIAIEVVPCGYARIRSESPRIGMPYTVAGTEREMKLRWAKSAVIVRDLAGKELIRRRLPVESIMLPFGTYVIRLEIHEGPSSEQEVRIEGAGETKVVFPEK